MAENLKITTPVTRGNNTMQVKGNKEPTPIGNIDPNRVLAKDGNAGDSQKNSGLRWDNGSVFQNFVTKLQHTPELSQTLGKLLTGTMEALLTGANETDGEHMLAQLAQTTVMDESQMLENILFQQQNNTKFTPELFNVLRSLAGDDNAPDELKEFVGRFLKAYDGYFSAPETMKSLNAQLARVVEYIPKSYRAPIEKAMAELQSPLTDDNILQNLSVLKEKVLPALGKYVATFNDFGETRNKIALIIHDISRLNVSSSEELVKRFDELMDYFKYDLNIPAKQLGAVRQMFAEAMKSEGTKSNGFIDALVKVLTSDVKEGFGGTSQAMIQDTMQSLLLDYNVYMPFTHIFLPVNYHGKQMFTDIWVEKDGGNGKRTGKTIYVKFDIKDTGSFQAAILLSGESVSCRLSLPEQFRAELEGINRDIEGIFKSNGFKSANISSAIEQPSVMQEIISRVNEGRNSVDVTV